MKYFRDPPIGTLLYANNSGDLTLIVESNCHYPSDRIITFELNLKSFEILGIWEDVEGFWELWNHSEPIFVPSNGKKKKIKK